MSDIATARTLSFFVPGHAKTKGSMVFVTKDYAKQTTAGSTTWAIMVASVARRAWRYDESMTGALWFSAVYVLPVEPTLPRSGDGDKLERNIWDALQGHGEGCGARCKKHAGIIDDDVQITRWMGERRMSSGADDPIGVYVQIGENGG